MSRLRASSAGRLGADHQTRLHARQQAYIDNLDDFRDFLKARAKLDLEYAQSMQRLAQTHLGKLKCPDVALADNNVTVAAALKLVYEQADSLASKHLSTSEHLTKSMTEPMRLQSKDMAVHLRRYEDLHVKYENYMTEKHRKALQAQKNYQELLKVHEKLEKDRDALGSGKKSLKNLTKTKAEMQQMLQKTEERAEQAGVALAKARNEYLLNIAAMNAQLDEYYTADLPKFIEELDGDFFDRCKDYMTGYAKLYHDLGQAEIDSSELVAGSGARIQREYEESLVLQDDVFTTRVSMDPPQGHESMELDGSDAQKEALQHEMQRLVNLRAEAQRTVAAKEKVIAKITEMFAMFAKQPDVPAETRQESANQLADEMFELTAARWDVTRCTARIDMLATIVAIPEERQQAERPVSLAVGSQHFVSDASWDQSTTNTALHATPSNTSAAERASMLHASTSSSASASLPPVPVPSFSAPVPKSISIPCVVIYDYASADSEELSITANERLTLVGEVSEDGWVKARNSSGREGLVPASYVDTNQQKASSGSSATRPLKATALYSNEEDGMLEFDEGDEIEILEFDDKTQDGYWLGRCKGKEGYFHSELVEMVDA